MAITKTTGTIVASAIRPQFEEQDIATAFANEIRGGVHSVYSISDRDSIKRVRREWGMLCYVRNKDTTYQLKYGKEGGSEGEDIMNDDNWGVFLSGKINENKSKWIEPVESILNSEPNDPPNEGARYIMGGNIWVTGSSKNDIITYEGEDVGYTYKIPIKGMVTNLLSKKDSIYKFDGYQWVEQRTNQNVFISAEKTNNNLYTGSTKIDFDIDNIDENISFFIKFNKANDIVGNITLNLKGENFSIKKPTENGLETLIPNDIKVGLVYSIIYNDGIFQLIKPFSTEGNSSGIKYHIEENDHVIIPPNHQYWVYGKLIIDGKLENYGRLVVANGEIEIGPNGEHNDIGDGVQYGLNGTTELITLSSNEFEESETIKPVSNQSDKYQFEIIDDSIEPKHLKLGTTASMGLTSSSEFLTKDINGNFTWEKITTGEYEEVKYKGIIQNQKGIINEIEILETPSVNPNLSIFLNGQFLEMGKDYICYLTDGVLDNDNVPVEKDINSFEKGDRLYWNGHFNIDTDDIITIKYRK